jgi:hypothetical protein
MEHVAKILSTVINNDTGAVSLYNFLNKLSGDINRVLGGINNLNITFNPDTNKGGGSIQLRDDTVIPGLTDMKKEDTSLRLYGTKPGQEGSFVTNVSSNTQIDSKLVTSISIGSVASSVNSSILLYQRIKTSGGILPLAYVNEISNKRLIDFVVLALDHSIQNNVWTTTVNALSVPTKTDRGKGAGKGGFSLHPQPEEDIEFTNEELDFLNSI